MSLIKDPALPKPDECNKICHAYIRVSTSKQAKNGISIEDQERKIRGWADLHEFKIADVYIERGMSGTKLEKREELERLRKTIREGEVLVAYDISRIARDASDFLNLVKELGRKGCHIFIIKDNVESLTSTGKLMMTVLSGLAEFEADMIKDKVKSSLELKKEKGERIGRIPLGWKAAGGPGSELVEIPEEQEVIKLIRILREEDKLSYEKIGRELDLRKIPTPGKSKNWSAMTVSRIYKRQNVITKGRAENSHVAAQRQIKETPLPPQKPELPLIPEPSARCHFYKRVNMSDKVIGNGLLEEQESIVKKWSLDNNYHIVDFYTDKTLSSTKIEDCVQLQRLINVIKEGELLIAYTASQLFSCLEDFNYLVSQLEPRGSCIYLIKENLESFSEEGKAKMVLLSQERSKQSQNNLANTIKNLQQKKL